MTAVDLTGIAPQPEPNRDRYGRYLIDGKPYTRVTTISSTLEDTYNLSRWQMRMAVHGVVNRDDLLLSAQTHNPTEDRQTYNTICQQGLEAAQAQAKANIGTALHKLTEQHDRGKPLEEFPEDRHPFLERYTSLLAGEGIEIDRAHIEQILVNTDHGYAGTADRVVDLPDGRRLIADLKTGATLDWSWLGISTQLAAYAHHTHTYNRTKDTLEPRIEIDLHEALVIHLPANGDPGALHLIDIEFGFEALLTALEAREMRRDAKKRTRLYKVGNPGSGGTSAVRDWLTDRVKNLKTADQRALTDLANTWPADVPKPLPDTPTSEQVDALDKTLTRIEGQYQIAFGPSRPGVQLATVSDIKTKKKEAQAK